MERKRGMTLAEICVTIAVISVMAAMITSFVIIVSRETKISTEYLDAAREIKLAENIIEQELESGAFISKEETVISGEIFQIVKQKLSLSAITNVDVKNFDGKEAFYVCKISYMLDGEDRVYSFCVDPIVGDVIYVEDGNEN